MQPQQKLEHQGSVIYSWLGAGVKSKLQLVHLSVVDCLNF